MTLFDESKSFKSLVYHGRFEVNVFPNIKRRREEIHRFLG